MVEAPVTVRAINESDEFHWTVLDAPKGSEAEFHDSSEKVTSISPDKPGKYTIEVTSGNDAEQLSFKAEPRSDLIEEYAPRLNFHKDAEYRPTRIEALVNNSVLKKDGEIVEENPTLFDLEDRDSSHYIELEGDDSYYPTYQEDYPETVYANVNRNTEYLGENYIGITYWFIYTYDSKHGFSSFGSHQADVESTMILLDPNEKNPVFVGSAAHGGITIVPFEQVAKDNRIDLYPEHKAHSSYLRDTSKYEGDGFQVYSFYLDSSSNSGSHDRILSAFHSDWTGSANRWTPRDYQLIELTGNEVWSTYRGGLDKKPESITPPHQRGQYKDQGTHMEERGFPNHEQVQGTISLNDYSTNEDSRTVDVTVANEGGKPHEFWVTIETENGNILDKKSLRVGTESPCFLTLGLMGGSKTREVELEFDTLADENRDLSVELWLHPPKTRLSNDFEDKIDTFTNTNNNLHGIWSGIGLVVIIAIIFGIILKTKDIEKLRENSTRKVWLPVLGGILGILGAIITLVLDTIIPGSTALGIATIILTRPPGVTTLSITAIIFSILGIISGTNILQKKVPSVFMIVCGIIILISLSAFGVIPFILFFIGGILVLRKTTRNQKTEKSES